MQILPPTKKVPPVQSSPGTAKKTFGKFLEYALVRTFESALRLLPFALRIRFTECLGLLGFHLVKRYRNLVLTHLKQAFPEKDAAWHKEIAYENFRYMGRLLAEGTCTGHMSDRFFRQRIQIKPDTAEHRAVFINGGMAVLGHLGNWEWHGHIAARLREQTIYTLVKRHTNYWSNQYLERTRHDAGMELIYVDENPFKIIKLLRRGEFVAFTSDQNARGAGAFVPFLGKLASTFLGPAAIARNSNVPVYFVWSYHDAKRRLVFEYEQIEPPQEIPKTDIDAWELAFTYSWVKKLEEKIRLHPTDYLWAHNRWKTRPENPDEVMAKWSQTSH